MGRLAEDKYAGLKARLKAEENTLADRCASYVGAAGLIKACSDLESGVMDARLQILSVG
jgi:hypothetical protein